jgi:hypothetical protein
MWIGVGFYFLNSIPKQPVVVYNCELSEISPDFPPAAREACRNMRAQSGRL